jgi:predicted type IV restriction endonuclease
MKEHFEDIRNHLRNHAYKNEDQIRVGIVGRILSDLGWDICNPSDIYVESASLPDYVRTGVDVTLLLAGAPKVLIIIKKPGSLLENTDSVEKDLRNLSNRFKALFSIATDGRYWRFYLSRESGEIRQWLFRSLDFLESDAGDIQTWFDTFISKKSIQDGSAESDANEYFEFSGRLQAFDDSLQQAAMVITEPPYPNLPDAIVTLMTKKGQKITREEAIEFITRYKQTSDALVEFAKSKSFYRNMLKIRPHRNDLIGQDNIALSQILDLYKLMNKGWKWPDAVKKIAAQRKVCDGTIRDKCTRQLAINTDQFLELISDKEKLKIRLNDRFPGNKEYIDRTIP